MCGIVGIIGLPSVAQGLVEGLRRLEYRGYDSAGIAVLDKGEFHRVRAEGKLSQLEAALKTTPADGSIGIGHTRWATHGVPNTLNAHPHMTAEVCVVHNGIIENFLALREELKTKGHSFTSETDTEVIPILMTDYVLQGLSPKEAFFESLKRLEGAFAIGVLFTRDPDTIYFARRGSPLAVGHGPEGEKNGPMYMASDAIALAPLTSRITYLQEGDWGMLQRGGVKLFDLHGTSVERPMVLSQASGASIGKGNFRHYMLKEIYEQPQVIGETLSAYYDPIHQKLSLPILPFGTEKISKITLVACGTSYYAAMVGKYWLERYCKIPVEVDIASEFRYRNPVLPPGGVFVCISQSGETADTLAALRHAKSAGQHTLAIVNVPESSMAREADGVLRTYAGPEIGVASTKAFTAQLMTLACAVLALSRQHGGLKTDELARLTHVLSELPARVSEVLETNGSIESIAHHFAEARDALYIGRGTAFPIALEGALKLKEISYIHAEAYAAGELKHGPIALIDEHMPVIVIAPPDELFEKTASNLQEVVARGGKVILIAAQKGIHHLKDYITHGITIPETDPLIAPILYALPVQLLAYHVAVLKGTDVDQPRNLAKSVTVE
ncbi:glutamine--fructose-6-phosphate transaminase (isomerizing) [bacterium]|nr:glutamine--fructose-6-phosphate transaminase (isomerizing) [bacterium]